MLDCNVVIMAAGRGTRMKSDKPKVLHTVGGMSMLQRVVNTAGLVEPRDIVVVVGCGSELVQQSVQGNNLHFVLQEPQLGTGHAVQQALPLLPDSGVTLILNGDVPLVAADDLAGLVRECAGKSLVLLWSWTTRPDMAALSARMMTRSLALLSKKMPQRHSSRSKKSIPV